MKGSLCSRNAASADRRAHQHAHHHGPARAAPGDRQLLTTLDRAEPQVEIEARIVRPLAISRRRSASSGGSTAGWRRSSATRPTWRFPTRHVAVGGRAPAADGGEQRPAVNLPVPAPRAIGVALGSINGAFKLDVALSALEHAGKGRILSTPRVTTQNNIEAEVTQGVQIPIHAVVANNTVTVTFKDAALKLNVTPQITAGEHGDHAHHGRERAAPAAARGQRHSVDRHAARQHAVQVTDGATTVIGGIFISA